MVDKDVMWTLNYPFFLLGNENTRENVDNSMRVEWAGSGQNRQDSVCLGSSAGFTTPRWCDPGLVTSSLWASGSLSFPVLISSCLSCSVDAMQSEIKLSNITLVKSLGTVIRSQGRIGFVLSRAIPRFVIIQTSCFSYPPLLLLYDWARGRRVGNWIMLLPGTSCNDWGRNIEIAF